MSDLHDFLTAVPVHELNDDNGYTDGQLARHLAIFENELPDITHADIVLAGINEYRGSGISQNKLHAADAIRKQLYQMHYWHTDVSIADIGNIKCGATLPDSYAAIKTVVADLLQLNKTVLLFGGSHDVTLGQYFSYKQLNRVIEVTCVDALINLKGENPLRSENFLLEMLTSEPNHVKHYNHLGFQSYFVHPRMLETLDKLRFDCFRLGVARENLEEMEPVLRNSHMLSFDLSAVKHSDAPAGGISPNGFTGEEACALTRFAGMSDKLTSMGIYGYLPMQDKHDLGALQIAQMIWYFIDGKNRSKQEAAIENRDYFNEYHTSFTEVESTFLQSKKTGRWWMQLPDKRFIPCSYADYIQASKNEIPERWLRAQERE